MSQSNGHDLAQEARPDRGTGAATSTTGGSGPATAAVADELWWFEPVVPHEPASPTLDGSAPAAGKRDESDEVVDDVVPTDGPAPDPLVVGTTPLGFVLRRRDRSSGPR